MEKKKPIKRHIALQPLSRQHHFGLLFSWKLRKGFSRDIPVQRMSKFADWFYEHEIKPHFKDEEKYLFPILDDDNELIQRALKEHRRIRRLFKDKKDPEKSLHRLEEELDAHIRFEERVLFNEIQQVATPEQLAKIEEIHEDLEKTPDYDDPFWED
jgi:iron-sulfur cluster repair protein YtfE (RIC family)